MQNPDDALFFDLKRRHHPERMEDAWRPTAPTLPSVGAAVIWIARSPAAPAPLQSAFDRLWLARRISAAFSPIMMLAAFVFPLMMLGITLASATRRFATPSTRS